MILFMLKCKRCQIESLERWKKEGLTLIEQILLCGKDSGMKKNKGVKRSKERRLSRKDGRGHEIKESMHGEISWLKRRKNQLNEE